jgi:hypothetical protein
MIRSRRGLAFFVGLATASMLFPRLVRAESLAELAAREKARRAHTDAGKVKTITAADLEDVARKDGTKSDATVPDDSGTAASQESGAEGSGEGGGAHDTTLEHWKIELSNAREDVASGQADVERLEAQLTALRGRALMDGVILDANAANQLEEQIATAKRTLEAAKQKVDDTLEAARRDGVPASQLE